MATGFKNDRRRQRRRNPPKRVSTDRVQKDRPAVPGDLFARERAPRPYLVGRARRRCEIQTAVGTRVVVIGNEFPQQASRDDASADVDAHDATNTEIDAPGGSGHERQRVKTADELRTRKIFELRNKRAAKQDRSGDYEIDAEAIAKRIVEDISQRRRGRSSAGRTGAGG